MEYEKYKEVNYILNMPLTQNDSITFSELLSKLKELEPLIGNMKVKIRSRMCFTESEDFLDKDYKLENVITLTRDWENIVVGDVQS